MEQVKQKQPRCPICGKLISRKHAENLRYGGDIINQELAANRQVINRLIAEKGRAEARIADLERQNKDLLIQVADLTAALNRIKSRNLLERIINK